MSMLLMPSLNARLPIMLMNALLPLRPANPRRLAVRLDANHLLGHRQVRIDSRRKGMDQLRPGLIPQPEHSCAITTEVAFRGTFFLSRLASVFDGYVFPKSYVLIICKCLFGAMLTT